MPDEVMPDRDQEATDPELVRATLTGCSEAFGRLVRRHQRPLYNAAYRIVGNRDDALDAVQNALVRIHRNLERFDLDRPFSSWAFRITVNEALRLVKRRPQERPEDFSGSASTTEPAAPGGPHRELQASEIREQLQVALQSLSDDQRTVLVLRHFQDLPYAEIADIVDIAEKTVKSRLFEARRALRKEMLRRGMLS